MSPDTVTPKMKLQALRLNYIGQLPQLVNSLAADCVGAIDNHSEPYLLSRAQRQAHTLAGTAGTFGLAEVSSCARELEEVFDSSLQLGKVPEGSLLRLRVSAVKEALARALSAEPIAQGGSP